MSNPNTVVTEQRLSEFYQGILPYLGGSADAGFTPVGTIIALDSNTPPANYLACDGTVYNIADYPELAEHYKRQYGAANHYGGNGTTTFAVIDLRGQFLRGTGTNSDTTQGNGSAVGVRQKSTEIPKLAIWGNTEFALCGVDSSNSGISYQDSDVNSSTGTKKWMKTNITSAGATGGTDHMTFRPTNTSVLFCIATKNIYLDPKNDYSTEEKVIGTWLDGSTIYQKTVLCTITNGQSNTAHNISNLGLVINAWGFTPKDDTSMEYRRNIYNAYYAESKWDCNAAVGVTNVTISAGEYFALKHSSVYLTIQYTKTT